MIDEHLIIILVMMNIVASNGHLESVSWHLTNCDDIAWAQRLMEVSGFR